MKPQRSRNLYQVGVNTAAHVLNRSESGGDLADTGRDSLCRLAVALLAVALAGYQILAPASVQAQVVEPAANDRAAVFTLPR